jgi:hypothetical protein
LPIVTAPSKSLVPNTRKLPLTNKLPLVPPPEAAALEFEYNVVKFVSLTCGTGRFVAVLTLVVVCVVLYSVVELPELIVATLAPYFTLYWR